VFQSWWFFIDPFFKIKGAFEAAGLKYDFSVVPGMVFKAGDEYDFDFSDTPKLLYYPFLYNPNIPETGGKFVEIPVSTFNNNPLYRLMNKLLLMIIGDKIYGDGIGIQEKSFYFLHSLKRRFLFSKGMLPWIKPIMDF
jgi:hypothetical protein